MNILFNSNYFSNYFFILFVCQLLDRDRVNNILELELELERYGTVRDRVNNT